MRLPSLSPKAVENFPDLRESAIPMLLSLGPSLHLDTVLLYKVIRLCKAALGVSKSLLYIFSVLIYSCREVPKKRIYIFVSCITT